jgi:2'-5' RNA ligase
MHEPILLEYNPWTRKMHIGEGNHRMEQAIRFGHEMVPVWGLKTSREHPSARSVPGEPKVQPEHFAGGYFPSSFKPSDVLPESWMKTREQAAAEEGRHPTLRPGEPGYRTAAVRTVPANDGPDGAAQSMMVAIVPPAEVLDMLQSAMAPLTAHTPEPRSKMHLTILYLGEDQDHPEKDLAKIPELVRQWAAAQEPFSMRIQGAGTFLNDGKHVLHALADIPGGPRLRASLEDFFRGHGIHFPRDHGFTPHITLAYSPHHVRFLPKVEPAEFPVSEVWFCRGGTWESLPLGRKLAMLH